MSQERLTFTSLFCGCGGFDVGFRRAGYRCVAAFDNDPHAVKAYCRNSDCPAELRDVAGAEFPLSRLEGVGVLVAGPPCQGFSTVGKRDPDDPRNGLLVTTGEIAIRVRPTVVLVENVRGVLAGVHKVHWNRLVGMLRAAGYRTCETLCEASQMGVAQTRKRMVLLAWDAGSDIRLQLPQITGGNLRDAIGDIGGAMNHVPRALQPGSSAGKIARRIGPGQKLCNVRAGDRCVHTWHIPEVFGKTTLFERTVLLALMRARRRNRIRDFGDADPVRAGVLYRAVGKPVAQTLRRLERKGYVRRLNGHYDLCHTFNGKYRRLSWEKPAPTVDTRFGQSRYYLHPNENRGFTVREAARIQGFPDSFMFDGPEAAHFRLIGNAVPPPLAQCLAEYIRDALLG